MKTEPIHVSKTDVERIILYLQAAAARYSRTGTQRDRCRAWCIQQLTGKLSRKLKDRSPLPCPARMEGEPTRQRKKQQWQEQ